MAQQSRSRSPRRGDHALTLDGQTLSPAALFSLSSGLRQVALSPGAWERVDACRQVVDRILKSKEVVYGVNTGFGLFSGVAIDEGKLAEMQVNLVRSHAAGVGEPLSRGRSRMLLALRINTLAKGHAGISRATLERMVAAASADCLPVVPRQGTVGANDLAQLSHLALGLMGEGKMWDPRTGGTAPAGEVLKAHGLQPIQLSAKEGLAMINGTQYITALGAEALERSKALVRVADVACALTLEALRGTHKAFSPLVHQARPHPGQLECAARIERLLSRETTPSELYLSHLYRGKVQDAYSLRCAPQVHGVAADTLRFVEGVLKCEMNSSTDNPMVFTESDVSNCHLTAPLDGKPADSLSSEGKPADASDISDLDAARREIAALRAAPKPKSEDKNTLTYSKSSKTFYQADGGCIISGGNFHGEYPAKMLDFLAIAVHELASISERRTERMCNPTLSELPPFLVPQGGMNSGFMIAQNTAAACVSENKVLTHPSSVDSISTGAAKEDHVSMGGFAAKKALDVVENVETVLAIEILAACQALELHRTEGPDARRLRTTAPLESVHAAVREVVKPWDADRYMSPDIEAVKVLIRSGRLLSVLNGSLSP